MEVVPHQCTSDNLDVVDFLFLQKLSQELPPIAVIFEDEPFSVSAVHYVIGSAFDIWPRGSAHTRSTIKIVADQLSAELPNKIAGVSFSRSSRSLFLLHMPSKLDAVSAPTGSQPPERGKRCLPSIGN
jgi:hypothetical protein